VFEIMDTEGKQIADQLMAVAADYSSAQNKVLESNNQIREIYAKAVKAI
jgi:hypothetical protein